MSNFTSWKDSIVDSIGLKEWGYDRLNQSEGEAPQQPTARRKFLKVAAGLALFWIIILAIATPYSSDIVDLIVTHNYSQPNYFHLLIPANQGSSDFCKTLFSAAALDYPTPRIINWGKEYEDPDIAYGGAHIAKIDGILGFFRQLGPGSDREMVLIVDGFDTWFQLRPSVLIDRYHAINDRANARIAERLGPSALRSINGYPINQTVVFAAQKRCWPATQDDPECYAVPESDLPTDVYGPNTDRDSGDQEAPFRKYRQRYLNSGTIMGPVGDLKRIFEAALEKAKVQAADTGSDQAAFAAVFGEQEYQREVLRARNLTSTQKFGAKFYRDARDDILGDHPTHKRPDVKDEVANFGIGLDYRGELSLPTVFSEDDAVWLKYSSASSVREAAQKAGVPAPDPPRVGHLAEDIKESTPPFWTCDYTGQTPVPDKDWSEVNIFTNLWTGVSPVTVHHNARAQGLKSRIRTTWSDTWYFPYLRELLKTKANGFRAPVAMSRGQEWWGPIDERGGIRIEIGSLPGDWAPWQNDDVCGTSDIANEVFQDKRGPWRNPIYYLPWPNDEQQREIDRLIEIENGEKNLQE